MTADQIVQALDEQFGSAIVEVAADSPHPHVVVTAERWHEVALFLRYDPRLLFDWLRCITGVDYPKDNQLVAVFDLHSVARPSEPDGLWTERHEFAVKVKVPRDNPHLPSVADVWAAAEWHEREAYDLLGIVFDGNPDSVTDPDGTHPRRILCPDDWRGYPLRKDYQFPKEYHGMPATSESEQSEPPTSGK